MTLYSLILIIHISTAVFLVGAVLYVDHIGLQWIRGKTETPSFKKMLLLHRGIYVGLLIMFASGLYMFLPLREYLFTVPAFYIKITFVGVLWINSLFIGKLLPLATRKPYALLETKERVPLYIIGAVSTTSWIGVILAATQLGL